MAGLSITSFDGHTLQSSNYATGLEKQDNNPFLRDVDVVQHRVPGKYAQHVRSDPRPAKMALHVSIVGTTALQTRLDELMQWFAPGTQGTLVADFDGSSRTVSAVVERIVPQYRGAATFLVLLAVADPRWYSSAAQTDATVVVATPTAISLANDGNADEDGLIIDVSVNTNKAAANSWLYAREIVVANRVPRALNSWAFNVAGTAWDHAALVTAVKSQADGDDVRVLVDGVQVDRWDGEAAATDWNSTTTQVWINLTMSPGLTAEVATATSAGGTEDIAVESGGTAGWPEKGLLLIENEVIRYTGKTEDSFTGISRAQRSTTAAVHVVGTAIYRVERRVQIVYGHTGITAPAANDHKKPMIDLANSTNTVHQWSTYGSAENDPRSMQWAYAFDAFDTRARYWTVDTNPSTDRVPFEWDFIADGGEFIDSFRPPANLWGFSSPIGITQLSYNVEIDDNDFALESIITDETGGTWIAEQTFGPATTVNVDIPVTTAYGITFRARQQAIVNTPDVQVADDDTFTTTKIRQAFTVPDPRDAPRKIERVFARLSSGGAACNVAMTLAIEDPATPGSYLVISDAVTVSVGAEAWYEFAFVISPDDRPVLAAGQTVYVEMVRTSGTQTMTWHGGVGEYEGAGNYRKMHVCSLMFDPDENTYGEVSSGNEISLSGALILDYVAGEVPYLNMLAEAAIYWHAWTITNTTTGQSVTADLFLGTGATIRLDVAGRRVYNPANDDELLFGVTFSDEAEWLTLRPGTNALTYAETGVVSVDVDSSWRDRWA